MTIKERLMKIETEMKIIKKMLWILMAVTTGVNIVW